MEETNGHPTKTVHPLIAAWIAVIWIAFSACSPAAQKSPQISLPPTPHLELPVIRVDNEHRAFEGGGGVEYQIPAGIGLVLDAAGYEFSLPADSEYDQPNMIQLMVDRDNFYGLPWKAGVTRYTLTSETLNPLGNSQAFVGLFPDSQVVVAIGYQRDPDNFHVLWAGIVRVVDKK